MSDLLSHERTEDMERHVRHVCRGIRSGKVRKQAEQEYYEHLEDHVYRLLLGGIPEGKAVEEAVAALGDPEELCHMLCAVHNRVPPDLYKNLLLLAVRALGAAFVGCVLWGFGLTESHPIVLLIPALIVFGLAPIRYLRSLILRVRQVFRLNRVCKSKGFTKKRQASAILSVFVPAQRPEWVIETGSHTYCVHFLAVHNRHATMRLLDSYAYTLVTTHGQGARFIDRAPRRFNALRTDDQTYENQSFHNLHFPISADLAEGAIERILLLNPVPSAIQYRKGTAMEYAGNGDRVFDFTLYDAKSFAELLKSVD